MRSNSLKKLGLTNSTVVAQASGFAEDVTLALTGDTLCCLAIPADMSVAEFCTFCGAYLATIREMRVLRREAMSKKHVCMVLIKFDSSRTASAFLLDNNNKPFCSLEPEVSNKGGGSTVDCFPC